MSDNGSVIHLRTGSCRRHNSAHRNEFCREYMVGKFHLPDILVCLCLCGDDLTAVDDGTAADSENEINIFFFR